MTVSIKMKINGETLQVKIEPYESLVEVLRDKLNLLEQRRAAISATVGLALF